MNARAHRLRHEAKLDDVARSARNYGLRWNTGRVGDLESGRIPATLPTLIALAQALGDATGEPISIADLAWFDGWVEVNPALVVRGDALASALKGQPVSLKAKDVLGAPERLGTAASQAFEQLAADCAQLGDIGGDLPVIEVQRVMNDAGVTEQRIAKELEISPYSLAVLSLKLWGSSFSAARDRQAGTNANAQRRGQVTRQMKQGLRRALEELSDGDD